MSTKKQYKYKYNNVEKYIEDTVWTTSKTSPSGYEYANEKKVTNKITYENLNKWVTSKEALGEYTYNMVTKKQYKYKHNNKIKEEDVIWTTSRTSPSGYEYANEKITDIKITYENLNKWVTSKGALGEYTYNMSTKLQYKYMYNNRTLIHDEIWTTSKTSPSGYKFTGESIVNSHVSYVDVVRWVDNRSELDDYTHNIETRKIYKYKYMNVSVRTESQWFDSNPGGDWVYANQVRKVKVN